MESSVLESSIVGASDVSAAPRTQLSNGAIVPRFNLARDMYAHMKQCTQSGKIMHYLAELCLTGEGAHICPTDLFPLPALAAYSLKNLGKPVQSEHLQWFNNQRGGAQGDYSENMPEKLSAVVKCLRERPGSKRAYIIIPNNCLPDAHIDSDAKCMQLINLMLEPSEDRGMLLNASVVFRAQAVEIFPKNIHFIGELLQNICDELGDHVNLGNLLYHVFFLVSTREA